jgi:hypothetical protein
MRAWLRPIYRPLKRMTRFAIWALPAATHLVSPRANVERRVLIVYDTATQPFSIGDLLIFQEASLLLCARHGLETVDLAIVFDPEKPAASDPVFTAHVTTDNVFYHLASVLPIAQTNPRLGSVFVFDSRHHLERYVNDNADRYLTWPSGWQMAGREYLSPVVFNDLLRRHFAEHRSIPHLTCRPFLRQWAEQFYAEHAGARVPVTVNLRNNRGWHLSRNSKIDVWIEFFSQCADRYPAVFVVICARSEIDDRLRACPNVIVAKDHDTGVEQDMALIHTSAMHMGGSSGPATMAWFNDKPYLMVNTVFKRGEFFLNADMIEQVDDDIQRVWFASPFQRVSKSVESIELLLREFALLWTAVDVAHWQAGPSPDAQEPSKLQSWLR